MEQMTVKELLEATGGVLLCGKEEVEIQHISIDSRAMKGNDLFVPLVGEKNDAHRFITQAMDHGAAAVLTCEHDEMNAQKPWIRVTDTKKALQDIGSYYRNRLFLPLVGVTGSVGKTTTREMIACALSAGFQVYKTPANHNSQVGVPLTLSEITSQDEIGVIELGMSEPGELTVIAKIARIDQAVITNIGVTHIEQLGSQENIYREKMSIQDGLKPGGTLFLNGDDEWLRESTAKPGCKTIYYGTGANCDYRAKDILLEDGYPVFTAVHGEERILVRLGIMGMHQVPNALAALAVADTNGISMKAAAEKLGQFTGFQNRQQIYEVSGIHLIDDTYNASPVSMKAAIDILVSMKDASRRIAVLADMKELGEDALRFHYEIGTYLSECPVDVVVTFGELAEEIKKGLEEKRSDVEVKSFLELAELEQWLCDHLRSGDSVLLKGSNSMKLGEVADHVRQHYR